MGKSDFLWFRYNMHVTHQKPISIKEAYFQFQAKTWPWVNLLGSPVRMFTMLIEPLMVVITPSCKLVTVLTLKTTYPPGASTRIEWVVCIMLKLCDVILGVSVTDSRTLHVSLLHQIHFFFEAYMKRTCISHLKLQVTLKFNSFLRIA